MSLSDLPDRFVETRQALHQVAFFAVGPARYMSEGRMGLRPTPGGFGTPVFEGRVARVEGGLLVYEQDGNVATQTITTVRKAASFFGIEYQPEWFADFHDPLRPVDPDLDLQVDVESALSLGSWFGFAWDLLNRLHDHGAADDDVSEVQIWPEHFDAATELGDADRGERASFGVSPGDDHHPEPYVYVAAWEKVDRSNPYWNSRDFNGASLSYDEIGKSDRPVDLALEFLLEGYRILHAG